MAILLKSKKVFIHIPKTGGSWVIHALKQMDLMEMHLGPAHADYERVFNFSGHYVGNYIKKTIKLRQSVDSYLGDCQAFAFVRHPVSYYESLWRFLAGKGWRRFSKAKNESRFGLKADLWHPWLQFEAWGNLCFYEFIGRIIDECPGYLTTLYERYIPYSSGVIVGRQESLREDFLHILELIYGYSFESRLAIKSSINASEVQRPKWDEGHLRDILMLESALMKRFGYNEAGRL